VRGRCPRGRGRRELGAAGPPGLPAPGRELGQKVLPVQRARRGTDPQSRRAALADRLCREGLLHAELRIQDSPGVLALTADLRTGKLRTSIEIPAPGQGQPLTWVRRLVRQLADAPADVHVETLVDGPASGPRGTLERLRPEPADLLPKDSGTITGFRLSLFKSMGSTRGSAETGFIRTSTRQWTASTRTVVTALEGRPRLRNGRPARRLSGSPGLPGEGFRGRARAREDLVEGGQEVDRERQLGGAQGGFEVLRGAGADDRGGDPGAVRSQARATSPGCRSCLSHRSS